MRISFRVRLFVVATAIVATVLATVMTIGWSRVLAVEVERLDDRLCMEARRMATQPLRAERIADIESDIAIKLRLPLTSQLMLRVDSNDGEPSVNSTYWSDAVEVNNLVWTKALRQADAAPRAPDETQRKPPREARDQPRTPDRHRSLEKAAHR